MLRKSHRLLAALVAVTGFSLLGATLSTSEARFTDASSSASNALSTGSVAAPTNVTVTDGNPMVLNWTATPTTAASGYNIYRSATSGVLGSKVATVTPRTTTTWTDNAPFDGNNYYVVKAFIQNWESGFVESPGIGAVTVTDNFNGTGAPAATEAGGKTWTAYNGTFNKTGSGTATASVGAGSNPFLTVTMPTGDVDVRTDVTSRSGEAAYFRVVDANDWSRLRLRRDNYTYSYYDTEYEWSDMDTKYEYSVTRTDYQYSYYVYGAWSGFADDSGPYCQTNPPSTPAGNDTTQYGTRAGTTCNSGTQTRWFITKSTRSKTLTYCWGSYSGGCSGSKTGVTSSTAEANKYYWTAPANTNDYSYSATGGTIVAEKTRYWSTYKYESRDVATGASRQIGPYTGNATDYFLHLEKSVNGTITGLGSWSISMPNGFRVTAVGPTLTVFADGFQVAVVNDSTNQTATLHGVGLGGSDTDAPGTTITYAYIKQS